MAIDWRAIGGTGRSGTSLLAEHIALHPDVVYFQEPFWFCNRNRKVLAYLRGEAGVDELRKTMERSLRNLRAGFEEQGEQELVELYDGLDPVLARFPGDDRAKHVGRTLRTLGIWSGRRYWIEKTPHNVRNADAIIDVFPTARIVHVIREPKDICASLLKQNWGPKGAKKFVPWYVGAMSQALEARDAVPKGQYLVVEMERLVRHPYPEMVRVLRFFGIEYDDDWLHGAVKDIDVRNAHIGRWYDDLNLSAQRYIDAYCQELYETWREIANG